MVFEEYYFPYKKLRKNQDTFIESVQNAIQNGGKLLVSAPTGLGKTVSALAPALKYAKENEKTVVYLTSRQTQINQVLATLKEISEKYDINIKAVGLVGKRNMCLNEGKEEYYGNEFNDFCKKMKEEGKCPYYKNFKKESFEKTISKIIKDSSKYFYTIEKFMEECEINKVCPYEVSSLKLFKADVVVCDFNYFFHLNIRENFLGRLGRLEDEIILIVDEAHNLPDRIRNMYSIQMNTFGLDRAIKEANYFFKSSKYNNYLLNLKNILENYLILLREKKKEEVKISKKEFLDTIKKQIEEPILLISELRDAEKVVKEDRIISYIGRVANFLEYWLETDEESIIRVTTYQDNYGSKRGINTILKILNIDPSVISSNILNNVFSTILMSATLEPLEMYRDILGIPDAELLELDSPFPKENLKVVVFDDLSTKYELRNNEMYNRYGIYIYKILYHFKKNTIIFFPSYDLMNKILMFIDYNKLDMKILKERKDMSKEEKELFIKEFKNPLKKVVLFGVTSGSFSEGLDLPENSLEIVIVVGLPLVRPNLVTDEIIYLYDTKFKKGKEYGYVYPAMSKIIQAGGRCIRTEKDKGIIFLMDNRFKWRYYSKIFPKYWHPQRFLGFENLDF